MGGGLLQLVAYGAQDAYISGNPHITFWKVLYKRHTNFAMESFRVNFTGAPNYGQRLVAVVNRNADLIWKTYVQVVLPDTTTGLTNPVLWNGDDTRRIGYILLKKIELEIGGQVIDTHYGEWLFLWECLTASFDTSVKLDSMVGGGYNGASTTATSCGGRPAVLYIPLQFWFCRNPGLALPLIALQYHEVRINLTFNDIRNLCFDAAPQNSNVHVIRDRVAAANLVAASLYIDYIYLDTDERRKFAQVSHEYLIDVLQFTGGESITSSSNKLKLNFNHPCKELIWVVQRDSFVACDDATIFPWKGQQPFNFSDWWDRSVLESGYSVTRVEGMAGKNPCITALIQLNGHDRFQVREGRYFNEVQPYQHHTNIPAVGINVYSFALQPEQHQPSGTCNLSRIDNTTLLLTVSNNAVGTTTTSTVYVYATNYNVLRVMSGMGGLAYSN